MTREELECTICKPAQKIQLDFEPGLIRRILNDVGDEPGNLPLLEFVLKELWERRRGLLLLNEAYDAIGGLEGAVATKADEIFRVLSPAEQKILQRVFLRIVRPSESGIDTRRRATFSELPPDGAELVFRLANERLLVTNKVTEKADSGLDQTVEVAHEALISNWGTLRAWVNEDREFLLWRERLGALIKEWERACENVDALLRGQLLTEAQKWFDQRSQDLSDQERKFILASRELRERLGREERERQERELEAARALADAQKERAEQAEKAQRLEEERAAEAERVQRLEAERAKEAEERRKEQVEAAQRLAEEQKQRAELSEQREREQKGAAGKLRQAAMALRRRALAAAAAAAAAVILLAVSVLMWRAAQEQAKMAETASVAAEGQARIAESRRLAAESSFALTKYPQRSLLLAVEAVKVQQPLPGVRAAAAEQSLRAALGFIGGRLVARSDGPIVALAISPGNGWVVTGSWDGTARLWDLSAKDPAANPVVLRGHEVPVVRVAISPDSHWVVTGSDDRTAWLWDLSVKDPAAEPVVLRGHGGEVNAVAISPDRHWVVTGSWKTARLWLLQVNDLVDLAHTIVGRNLSRDESTLYFPGEKYHQTFPDLPIPE